MSPAVKKGKKGASTYQSVFRLLVSNGILPEGIDGSENDPEVRLTLSPGKASKIVSAVQKRRKTLNYEYNTETGRMKIWRRSEGGGK